MSMFFGNKKKNPNRIVDSSCTVGLLTQGCIPLLHYPSLDGVMTSKLLKYMLFHDYPSIKCIPKL